MWSGLTSTNRGLSGIVLNDGTYYLFYSAAGSASALGGFLQGTGASTAGTFASTNTKDFNLEGPALVDATLTAPFVARTRFNGTVTYPGQVGTGTFTTTFDSDYDLVPSLATLAGTYSGQSGSTSITVTMTITTAGAITGRSSGGCAFTGTAAARAVGNAYDITLSFGPAPCDLVNTTLRGIGLYDASLRQLLAVGLNTDRNQGFLFLGNKPTANGAADLKSVPRAGRFTGTANGEVLTTFGKP